MQELIKAYFSTALFTSIDSLTGNPLDDEFSFSDISEETVQQTEKDISEFLNLCAAQGVAWNETNAHKLMHDFWLTRNCHGAGFWDGDYPVWGEKLTAIAHMFAEVDLYVGDDGKIYHV